MKTLTHEEAKAFYDKFGRKQDRQAFYEEAALEVLIANSALDQARSVVEFGCGTGRLARALLERHLAEDAQYLGTDLSSTMVAIASERLTGFAARASVQQTTGEPKLPVADASVDRVLSSYVFDLLSDAERDELLVEARRALTSDGLLGLCGITDGTTLVSRAVMSSWSWIYARSARLVGGCRPTRAAEVLEARGWKLRHHQVVVAWGVASEVVVASPPSASRA
ncbi:MAG: class I SAM-dependent methyltransferase [Kofleriaceae bacterium]